MLEYGATFWKNGSLHVELHKIEETANSRYSAEVDFLQLYLFGAYG